MTDETTDTGFRIPTRSERKARQQAAAEAGIDNPTPEERREIIDTVPVPEGLSSRYVEFARQFLVTYNATKSALAIGIPEASAAVEGSRLLRNSNIQRYLADLQREMGRQWRLNADVVRGMLIQSHFQAAADKQHGPSVRAAELLGKSLPNEPPMFLDRQEHSHRIGDTDLLSAIRELSDPDELRVLEHALDRSQAIDAEPTEES